MQVLYQAEQAECGLVSLAMVATAYGLHYDLASLRARYPVSLKGSTLKDIVAIARDLGLETRALRCEVEELEQLRLPAILHWRMDHFVVLTRCRGDRYYLNDPAVGEMTAGRREMREGFTGVALEAWPGAHFEKGNHRSRLRVSGVIPRGSDVRGAIISMFVLAMGMEAAALVLPIIQQLIIDDALVTSDKELAQLLTLAAGVFLLGHAATAAIRAIVQRNLTAALSMIVPAHAFTHLAALPATWFERRSATDVVNRLESSNVICKTLMTSIVTAGIDGLVAVIALAIMAIYSTLLTGLVIAAFALYALMRVLWFSSFRRKSAGALVQAAQVQGVLWETMRGITTIKLFNGEALRRNQYLASLSRYVKLQTQLGTINTGFGFVHDLIFAGERLAVIYFGATAVLNGQLSVGMLTALLSFRERFVTKGTNLINTGIDLWTLGIHLERLADILLTAKEPAHPLPFSGSRRLMGRLEARNLAYRYGENDADVLVNCSMCVAPGEVVAIVGPSGSGKSTLLKVLTGQLQPRSGEVIVDDLSIGSIGLQEFRHSIAVVRQDDMLFAGTITENIAFFAEAPDHARVQEAAAKARIHDEIMRMPMGYNTLIGSMGTGLSGGQVLRIMLARALYRQPRILFLDEATSHLDLENEKQIAKALKDLGITQVLIAHRPETIAIADRTIDILAINRQLTSA